MSKIILRKYGEATTIPFPLFEINGIDFKIDAVYVSGDVKLMKDEGAEDNVSSGFTDEGQGNTQPLNATEMEFARGVLYIVDQGTKAWLDTNIIIETYGHASAQHEVFPANIIQISGDSVAADNLELQYDTTGLTGDTFPATQLQLGNIALTGSAVSTPAKDAPNGFVITSGENEANNEDSTHALDGVTHDLEATNDGGIEKIECYYEFAVGGAGVPTSITSHHQFNKGGDSLKNLTVWAYNWNTTSWNQIGTLSSSTSLETDSYTLFTSHVGTGGNLGLVRIRYLTGSVLLTSTSKLLVDQIFVEYAVINKTVGYADGAIWVDTNASNTNTESFVDGTADNPVSTWAAALTLSGQLNITRFHIVNGSAITLTGNSDNYNIMGQGYTLALNNQSIASAYIFGATTSGIGTGGGTVFEDCPIGNVTLDPSVMRRCFYFGTIINSGIGDWFINDPRSRVAGSGSPVFDFGTAVGNTKLNIRGNSGGWQLESMGDTGIDTASIEGWGQVVEGTCTGGTVVIRGAFTTSGITNLTLSDDSRYDSTSLISRMLNTIVDNTFNVAKSWGKRLRGIEEYQGYEGGSIYINTTGGGAAGADPYTNGVLDSPVDNLADALTLSAALKITCFNISAGSSLAFISSQDNKCFMGNNWTLALGGQSINGIFIAGAKVSGVATATTTEPKLNDCTIGESTLPPGHYHNCGFLSKITAGTAGNYFFTNCESDAADAYPVFDSGVALANVNAIFREYRGELELENMGQVGTDTASIDGNGRVKMNANSIGGTISVQGHQELVNRAAFITAGGTVNDASRFATDQLAGIAQAGADGDTLKDISDQIDGVGSANIIHVAGGGGAAPSYADEGEAIKVVQGDVIDIPRYLEGDYTDKRVFFGAKANQRDAAYAITVRECNNLIYDSVSNKTSYMIPFVAADTESMTVLGIYKAEVEVRDADGITGPFTPDRFDCEIVGQIIKPA